ncbi:MAG: leucine-rich repeat domain-containing protein, partial [Paludibacteraceae bacterium]|nr:leucine-rich repeat domain-containing protein [Paludibacteraceae bacterium]
LPASVSRLGQAAFMNCSSLKSINLPKTQKTLPAHFFEGCTSLEKIELPATLTTIETDAFYGCSKLSNVNLHEGLTTIGSTAFYNCALTEITIPSTVTSIGNSAFKENPMTTIVWKSKDCSIGSDNYAPFYGISSVTSFTFADGVEVVPAYICKYMSKLDTIVLPASVSRLGQAAFMYCTSLKSINLPKTQKTLPANFLEGCSSLEKIELPATLTTISQDAFYGCSGLKEIYSYAKTPPTIVERSVYNVNKQTCKLYVPTASLELYAKATVWKDFLNRIGMEPIHHEFAETACDEYTWDGTTYYESGDKVKEYVAVNGLDSIVVLHLTINPSFTTENIVSELESYTWNGKTYTESGDYEFVGTTAAGCDSTAVLHLTIIPVWQVTLTQPEHGTISVVENIALDKVPDGTELHFAAIPDEGYEFEAWQGCNADGSLVVKENISISCTFREIPTEIHHEFTETACDEYTWDGTTYYESGDKVKEYVAVNGLDSIVVLHLTINNSFKTETIVSELESYTWNGKTYTESGDYEFVGTTAAGCDSTAVLHLTIIPVWQVTLTQPDHGTISVVENIALDKVPDGTELHFAAIPAEGYEFDAWQGCNADGSLVVKENVSVSCTFKEIESAVLNIETEADEPQKIIRNGALYIRHNGRTYTITGVEIR